MTSPRISQHSAIALAVASALAAASGALRAADDTTGSTLEEIVVTATRRAQTRR